MRHLVFAALFSIAALASPKHALAQTTTPAPTGAAACTQWITSLPANITAPGYYCLKQNIATNLVGGAFNIDADNVTLDCRGRSVTHTDPLSEATGVGGGGFGPVHNVTVRGCRFIGFGVGIVFTPGSDNIEIVSNDILKFRYDGIQLWTSHSRIAGNNLLNAYNDAYNVMNGILVVDADDVVVANNIVSGIGGVQIVRGVSLQRATNVIVNNNQFVDLAPSDVGYATAIEADWISAPTARLVSNLILSRSGNVFGVQGQGAATCTRNIAVGFASANFESCAVNVANIVQP